MRATLGSFRFTHRPLTIFSTLSSAFRATYFVVPIRKFELLQSGFLPSRFLTSEYISASVTWPLEPRFRYDPRLSPDSPNRPRTFGFISSLSLTDGLVSKKSSSAAGCCAWDARRSGRSSSMLTSVSPCVPKRFLTGRLFQYSSISRSSRSASSRSLLV